LRKLTAFVLVLALVLSSLAFLPSPVLADNGKAKKIPPGQAKKYYLDFEKFWDKEWNNFFDEMEKYLNKNQNRLLDTRFLTRAQVAYILGVRSADYKEFDKQETILAKVTDKGAIPARYRKAVAYVIDKELMSYTKHNNGKITFQPNKAASLSDVKCLTEDDEDLDDKQEQSRFSGTVRFRYVLGNRTWIAVETTDGILRTAYFASGTVPANLAVGTYLTVKVQGYRILESSLKDSAASYNNLTFVLATDPAIIRLGDEVTFLPQLINSSSRSITLENFVYRFGLQKVGSSNEQLFTASSARNVVVPGKNENDPVNLVAPSQKWIPASTGDYVLTRAQIRVDNGPWYDINFRQPTQFINLLTANQSNIESGTAGFSPYGNDTYAGAALRRDTTERWQGQASLRVTTNGLNPWQGVNVVYSGSQISGRLTYSFYIKAEKGVPIRVKVYDNSNGTYPGGGSLEFTGTGSWERQEVSFRPTGPTKELSLQVTLNNSKLVTNFWLDGLQLEQGSKATAWKQGGTVSQGVLRVTD